MILSTLQCSAAREIEFGRNCVENWKERVNLKERLNLKERVNLKRDVWWPWKWVAFQALNLVLHLLITALLSIPGLMYIVQQSVGSYGVLKVFANATVVSISGSLLKISLYWVATKLATFQQMVYVNQKVQVDKIKFNRWRTTSMFMITWAMDVLVPIACIVVFDESCLRQYLKFSPSISGIMDYWAIGQTGFDAYRKGFCLQKLINVFSPVWCTTACISVFISPAQRMWLSSPAYHNATKWLNQWWQQKCSSEELKEIAAEENTSEAMGWRPAAFISGTDVDAKAESSSTALSPEPNALAMTAGNELQNESCSASQIGGSSKPASKVVDAEMVNSKDSKESGELERRIKEQSVEIAQLLSLIATASCFGLLVPALLFFVALSIPLWLLAIDCVDSFGSANDGAHQVLVIQRVLVAYPKNFASAISILSTWVVMHFLLFDFGFPLGCWALFELSCVGLVLGVVLIRRIGKENLAKAVPLRTVLFRKPNVHDTQPKLITFDKNKGMF